MDVAGRGGFGTVRVAVGVDPEHAAGPVRAGEAAERPDRNGVVAAEHERMQTLLDRARNEVRNPLAGLLDRRQEANALAAHLRRLGNCTLDVPPVEHRPPQPLDASSQAGVADRGGSHVDAAPARPEVETRTDQGNGPLVRLRTHSAETTVARNVGD